MTDKFLQLVTVTCMSHKLNVLSTTVSPEQQNVFKSAICSSEYNIMQGVFPFVLITDLMEASLFITKFSIESCPLCYLSENQEFAF